MTRKRFPCLFNVSYAEMVRKDILSMMLEIGSEAIKLYIVSTITT